MRVGFGIFLAVVGAILAFGVKANIQDFDLTTIGFILMGAGVLVVVVSLLLELPRTRRSRSTAITTDQYGQQVVTERDDRISGV